MGRLQREREVAFTNFCDNLELVEFSSHHEDLTTYEEEIMTYNSSMGNLAAATDNMVGYLSIVCIAERLTDYI